MSRSAASRLRMANAVSIASGLRSLSITRTTPFSSSRPRSSGRLRTLSKLAEEIRAAIDDFFIIVIAGGVERLEKLRNAGEGTALEQGAKPLSRRSLTGAPEEHARTPPRWKGGRRVLQVDGAKTFQLSPDAGSKPRRLGGNPVDQQQPVLSCREPLRTFCSLLATYQ